MPSSTLRRALQALVLPLLSTGLAQAQNFNATLLTRPAGTDTCFEAQGKPVLGPHGEIGTDCNLRTASIFGAPVSAGRAVVWRGGSATGTVLPGTLLQPRTTQMGLLADGTVLGYAYSGNSATLSAWKGSTRSNRSLPAGYSGWELDRISPDGQTQLIFKRNDGSAYGRGFALVKAGVVKLVASPPAACGSLNTTSEKPGWVINNVGQMALSRTQQIYNSANGSIDRPGTLCLWDGAQWQVSARTPNYMHPTAFDADLYDMSLRGLNDQGEVLADRQAKFTWHPSRGFNQVDERAWVYTASGELAGGASVTATDFSVKAVLWRNGQAVHLDQLATAPAGYQLSTVLAANARGEVLVLAQATGSAPASSLNSRLVLLTPR